MKKIYVTKPYLPSKEKYIKYIEQIWDNGILTNYGPLYTKLSKKIEKLINNDNINLYCNGHQALEILIKSLEMPLGGEIITTPFTFISTTHAIVNCGYEPVFCDIKMSDYTIDEDKIEELISEKTVAILAVHVYGFPCNLEKIEKIAKKYKLKVIYDAAHAFGVSYKGNNILNYGDISMSSFHATKLFNTIEGGITVSASKELCEKQKKIQNFGIAGYDDVELVGTNAKMSEFNAAMGLATIGDLKKIIRKRKKLVNLYKKYLDKIDGITTYSFNDSNIEYNYAYFPIVIDENVYGLSRDKVKELLESYGIFPRKYFYPLTCDMTCYKESNFSFLEYNVDNARYVSNNVLTLPLYCELEEEVVEKICDILRRKK